jgi:hypothetical protein
MREIFPSQSCRLRIKLFTARGIATKRHKIHKPLLQFLCFLWLFPPVQARRQSVGAGLPIPIPKDPYISDIVENLHLSPASLPLRSTPMHTIPVQLRLVQSSFSLSFPCRGLSYTQQDQRQNPKATLRPHAFVFRRRGIV